jgi:hypothetical protein
MNPIEEPDDQEPIEPELGWLDLGSEPWWMQDIRLAQRAIEAERRRLRARGPDSGGESGS